jgi:hypothetical protein
VEVSLVVVTVVVVVVGADDSALLLAALLVADAEAEPDPTSPSVEGDVVSVLGNWVTKPLPPAPPPAPTVPPPSHPATSTTALTASRSERMTVVVRGTARFLFYGISGNKDLAKP